MQHHHYIHARMFYFVNSWVSFYKDKSFLAKIALYWDPKRPSATALSFHLGPNPNWKSLCMFYSQKRESWWAFTVTTFTSSLAPTSFSKESGLDQRKKLPPKHISNQNWNTDIKKPIKMQQFEKSNAISSMQAEQIAHIIWSNTTWIVKTF